MPTVYTFTVGSSGRNYATVALALADISSQVGSNNLVSVDAQVILNCYNDSVFTGRTTISGFTTDATRNIIIQAAPGQRHTRVSGTGVRFQPNAGSGHVFTILDNFISLLYLEIFQRESGASASDECIRLGDSSNNVEGTRIAHNLIRSSSVSQCDCIYMGNYSVGTSGNPIFIHDNVMWLAHRAAVHCQFFSGSGTQWIKIVNCTMANCDFNIGYDVRDSGATINFIVVNCLLVDSGSGDFAPSFGGGQSGTVTTTGSANNFDERSQVPSPGSPNPIIATSNSTPGAGNWAIFYDSVFYTDLGLQNVVANSVLGGGVGPSSNSNVSALDCIDNPRSGTTCDPGALETYIAPPSADFNRALFFGANF